MLQIFCQECGAPTEYTLTKPCFCARCGRSFVISSNFTPKIFPKPPLTEPKISTSATWSPEPQTSKPPKKSKIIEKYLQTKSKKVNEELDLDENIDDDLENEITEVPQLESLEVDFIGNKPVSVNLGDILRANTGKTPVKIKIPKSKGPKPPKINKEEVWKQFRQEAGKSEKIDIGDVDV